MRLKLAQWGNAMRLKLAQQSSAMRPKLAQQGGRMKLLAVIPMVAVTGMLFAAPAHARLPPPSAEQQAAAAQKKAEEAAKAREQQEALTRVQDRLAGRFGRGHSAAGAGQTAKDDLPRKAIDAKGSAGPIGGREQSAEAHSAPVR